MEKCQSTQVTMSGYFMQSLVLVQAVHPVDHLSSSCFFPPSFPGGGSRRCGFWTHPPCAQCTQSASAARARVPASTASAASVSQEHQLLSPALAAGEQ